jgi:hypothetical protein
MANNEPRMLFALPSIECAALWEAFCVGQLSDGYWEGARPLHHWVPWCSARVVVDAVRPGREGAYVPRDKYALDNKELMEILGFEMQYFLGLVRKYPGHALVLPKWDLPRSPSCHAEMNADPGSKFGALGLAPLSPSEVPSLLEVKKVLRAIKLAMRTPRV